MKDRQKKMLRFMLIHEGVLHIEDLAEAFSIGKRTVSRDLDVLENWLSFRGAGLERIPNQGIRVLPFGSSIDELIEKVNKPEAYLESLSPVMRQKLILLYLLFNNREIKISSIANAFFISDTSVWSDLNYIESELKGSTLYLERLKGVGIHLAGEESQIRLKFLTTISEGFSSHIIIPYLYTLKEDKGTFLEINQLKFLINRLNLPANNTAILNVISETSEALGYQFTMSGEALLYFYLQLTVHRIKSGALIKIDKFEACVAPFEKLGESILLKITSKVFNGNLPAEEKRFLGLLLQVLEVGDVIKLRSNLFEGLITDPIRKFTSNIIDEFGKIDKRQYYLNERMETVLSFTAASLIMRLKYGIPFWHGNWGEPSLESCNREEKTAVLSDMIFSQFNLVADKKDLDYILIYFHSMIFSSEDLPDKKVRCLLCCFEGIGLASYLHAILKREIESINIVESTAVFKVRQEYLDANRIELVISTFPINDLEIPVIPISLPLNKEQLVKNIAEAITDVKKNNKSADYKSEDESIKKVDQVSFSEIVDFINDFSIIPVSEFSNINKTIIELSGKLAGEDSDVKRLADDFQKRENSGPLYFEEWGIRVLHCKSKIITKPIAGLLDFDNADTTRMLFMVAPSPCPDYIRKMLSTITISIIENSGFRAAVLSAGIDTIKRRLMEIYQEPIQV